MYKLLIYDLNDTVYLRMIFFLKLLSYYFFDLCNILTDELDQKIIILSFLLVYRILIYRSYTLCEK